MLAFLYLKFETFAHVHIAIARYFILLPNYMTRSQREKCPNAEFFLVRIFLFSDWIPRFTQFEIFKPLIYCFEETIRFDVKASFGSRLVLPLITN